MSESNNGDFRNFKDLEKEPGDKPVTLEIDRELPPGIASEKPEVVLENLASRGMIIPTDKDIAPEVKRDQFDAHDIGDIVLARLKEMLIQDIELKDFSLTPEKDGSLRLHAAFNRFPGTVTIECFIKNEGEKISIVKDSLKIDKSFFGKKKFNEEEIRKNLEDLDTLIREYHTVPHGLQISRIQIAGGGIEISYKSKQPRATSPKPDETVVLKRSGDGLTIKSHGEKNETFLAKLPTNPRVNATAEDISAVEALVNKTTQEIPKIEGSTDATLIPASHEEFADSSEMLRGEESLQGSPSAAKAPESEPASATQENPFEQEIWSPRNGMAPASPESAPVEEDPLGSLIEEPIHKEPAPAIETAVAPTAPSETPEPQVEEPVVEQKTEEPTTENNKVGNSSVEPAPEPSAPIAPEKAPVAETQPEVAESEEGAEEELVYLPAKVWQKIGRGFERLSKRPGMSFDVNALKWQGKKKGEESITHLSGIPDASFSEYEIVDFNLYGSARIVFRDKGLIEQDPIQTTIELHAYYPQLDNVMDELEGMVSDEMMPELLDKADRILAIANEDDLKGIEVVLEFDEENITKDGDEGVVGTSGILILNLADSSERLMGFMADKKTFVKLRETKEKYEKGVKEAVEAARKEAESLEKTKEVSKTTPEASKGQTETEEVRKNETTKEIKALDDLRKRYSEGTEFLDAFRGDMPLEEREALILKARQVFRPLADRKFEKLKFILQGGVGKDFPSSVSSSGRIILNLDEEGPALTEFMEQALAQREQRILKGVSEFKALRLKYPDIKIRTRIEGEELYFAVQAIEKVIEGVGIEHLTQHGVEAITIANANKVTRSKERKQIFLNGQQENPSSHIDEMIKFINENIGNKV